MKIQSSTASQVPSCMSEFCSRGPTLESWQHQIFIDVFLPDICWHDVLPCCQEESVGCMSLCILVFKGEATFH